MNLFEDIECVYCDAKGEIVEGELPLGWELVARGRACSRQPRRTQTLIIYACPTCRNKPLEERCKALLANALETA